MKRLLLLLISLGIFFTQDLNGFVEYGVATKTATGSGSDYILNEAKVQLKYEHSSDHGELFFRVDFVNDNLLNKTSLSIREAYFTSTPFDWMDVKIGRQIQTWGVGDLLFINDVFRKDWISFFAGRSDQYLKAPNDALRFSVFPEILGIETLDFSIMPQSDSDINLQSEGRFRSANPIYQSYANRGISFAQTKRTQLSLKNAEFALRLKLKQVKNFTPTLYLYSGRWNNPYSLEYNGTNLITPYFSKLNVYGASLRGQIFGGILSLETGFYDSRDDKEGSNPLTENSSFRYLALFETSLSKTINMGIQFYTEVIQDYDKIEEGFNITIPENSFLDKDGLRDETRHLITLRLTQKMLNETLWLTWFSYYSATDEDYYLRPRLRYDYSDHVRFIITGNFFDAFGDNNDSSQIKNGLPNYHNTMFGQFRNDQNINLTFKYIF